MRSGTDCGNKKRRIDCRLVLEMAPEEPFQTGGWGVAQRSPLGLSVRVSVQWFGSSSGTLGCCWVWFPHRGISIRKFPILFLLPSVISTPRPTLPPRLFRSFPWSQGLMPFQHHFQTNQQTAFASRWRVEAPAQPSPSGGRGVMGPLRWAATRELPGAGRSTVSPIPVTALSFSDSAVNIR